MAKTKADPVAASLLARVRTVLRRTAYHTMYGDRMFTVSLTGTGEHVTILRNDTIASGMSTTPPKAAMEAKFAAMCEELGATIVTSGVGSITIRDGKITRLPRPTNSAPSVSPEVGSAQHQAALDHLANQSVPVSPEAVKAAAAVIGSSEEREDPHVVATNASQLAEAHGMVLAATMLAMPDEPVAIECALMDCIEWPDAVPQPIRDAMERAVLDRIRNPELNLDVSPFRSVAVWESMRERVQEVAKAAYTLVRYGNLQ